MLKCRKGEEVPISAMCVFLGCYCRGGVTHYGLYDADKACNTLNQRTLNVNLAVVAIDGDALQKILGHVSVDTVYVKYMGK